MRLGQLARKLGVRPAEIAEFLTKENIQVEAGSNTRIEDDLVILVTTKFSPDQVSAIRGELIREESAFMEEEVIPESLEEVTEPDVEVPTETEQQPLQSPIVVAQGVAVSELPSAIETQEAILVDGDVIRAPKVELQGLKVLGKIELPELKKKEVQPIVEPVETIVNPEEAPAEPAPVAQEVPEKKVSTYDREKKKQQDKMREQRKRHEVRPRRNPLEVKREREAEELKKKKAEEAKLEKEKRTLNYKKKVKVITPSKNKTAGHDNAKKKAFKEEAPTSLWGRFKKWLKS